jgi:class 3 adenylate cyclase
MKSKATSLHQLKSTNNNNNSTASTDPPDEDDNTDTDGKTDQSNNNTPVIAKKAFSMGDILRRKSALGNNNNNDISNPPKSPMRTPHTMRRKTAMEEASAFTLTPEEISFLPHEVRKRLGKRSGQLPPAPALFKSRGVVLFVDVSGFTKLGEELRGEHGPISGGAMLAGLITKIISVLTNVCLDYGGDVAKFAGDALLCMWENGVEETLLRHAKECALEMLKSMKEFNRTSGCSLDIHGGIATGSILHLHLSSADDDVRWYLTSGGAHAGATTLVDQAAPGEILVMEPDILSNSANIPGGDDNPIFRTGGISGGGGGASVSGSNLGLANANMGGSFRNSNNFSGGQQQQQHHPNRTITSLTSSATSSSSPPKDTSPRPGGGGDISSNASSRQGRAPTILRQSQAEVKQQYDVVGEVMASKNSGTIARHEVSFGKKRGTIMSMRGEAADLRRQRMNTTTNRNSQAFTSPTNTLQRSYVPPSPMPSRTPPPPNSSSNFHTNSNNSNTTTPSRPNLLNPLPLVPQNSQRTIAFDIPNDSSSEPSTIVAGSSHTTILTIESTLPGVATTGNNDHKDSISIDDSSSVGSGARIGGGGGRGRIQTEEDPVLRSGLPRFCNVYIPKSLRKNMAEIKPEMRIGVAIIFVDVEDLVLTPDEMRERVISDDKMDDLNAAFVRMTRVTHAFGGEVRDFLFDDKGCVFIGVFGAHPEKLERDRTMAEAIQGSPELRATRAAMAIRVLINGARVGVSSGTCFVGMCGVEKRRDFIVIGHDVNCAARLMCQADRDQVLVTPEVHAVASQVIRFTSRTVFMRKKNKSAEDQSLAYIPSLEAFKDEAFLACFRYELLDKDYFVGRVKELEMIENTLNRICLWGESPSGTILVESDMGMGKSSFVLRVRKMGKGRLSIFHGQSRSGDHLADDFSAWKDIVQSMTGLAPNMRAPEIKEALKEYTKKGPGVDAAALSRILKFVGETLKIPERERSPLPGSEDPLNEAFLKDIAIVGKTVINVLVNALATNRSTGARGLVLIFEGIHNMDVKSLALLDYVVERVKDLKKTVLFVTVRVLDGITGGSPRIGVGGLTPLAKPTSSPSSSNNNNSSSSSPATNAANNVEETRIGLLRVFVEKLKRSNANGRGTGGTAVHLKLGSLNMDDAELLIARSWGRPPTRRVAEKMYTDTEGKPMYLTLWAQWLREKGRVIKVGEEFDWNSVGPASVPPGGVPGLIIARYNDLLDDKSKEVLKVLAITDMNEFDAIFVQNAFGWGSSPKLGKSSPSSTSGNNNLDTVLNCLRKAREVGFLVHIDEKNKPEREHAWRFKHEVVVTAIRGLVSNDEIKRTNERLADEKRASLLRLKVGWHGDPADYDLVCLYVFFFDNFECGDIYNY